MNYQQCQPPQELTNDSARSENICLPIRIARRGHRQESLRRWVARRWMTENLSRSCRRLPWQGS